MTIFSKIINGDIPCFKVAENEHFFAFLDINPLTEGHTLVIPKREVDYIFDLTDEETAQINLFAKQIAIALKKAVPCLRIGTCVMGLEVPHAHIHLVPLHQEGDLNFTKEKLKLTPERMQEIAQQIQQHLA